MRVPALAAVLVVAAATGCGGPLVVSDRHDVGRDRENIHTYASGAVVAFSVRSESIFVDAEKLVATSSDETVFTVADGLGGVVQILTVSAGSAELVFRLNDEVVDSRRLQVKDAARVELFIEEFANNDDDHLPEAVRVPEPLLALHDRETRLVVHAFDADDGEVFGNAITAIAVDDTRWRAELGNEGPYSTITLSPATAAEATTMALQVGGPRLTVEIPCEPRETADIERLILDEGGTDGLRNAGHRSVVIAHAQDAAGRTILGNPGWQLEGEDAGIGFAVEYTIGFGVPGQTLVARLGQVEVQRTIYPDADSVAAIDGSGCGAVNDSGATATVALAFAAFALRRRRRSI